MIYLVDKRVYVKGLIYFILHLNYINIYTYMYLGWNIFLYNYFNKKYPNIYNKTY